MIPIFKRIKKYNFFGLRSQKVITFSDYVPKSLQNTNNFSSFFFALYKKSVNLHWKVRKSVSITHKIEPSSVIYEKDRQRCQ